MMINKPQVKALFFKFLKSAFFIKSILILVLLAIIVKGIEEGTELYFEHNPEARNKQYRLIIQEQPEAVQDKVVRSDKSLEKKKGLTLKSKEEVVQEILQNPDVSRWNKSFNPGYYCLNIEKTSNVDFEQCLDLVGAKLMAQ